MTRYNEVHSTTIPEEKVIDDYSVWVCKNIREIQVTDENGVRTEYEYDMIQYSKDEYIKIIDEKNENLERNLTDTQIALCDVYEMIGGI